MIQQSNSKSKRKNKEKKGGKKIPTQLTPPHLYTREFNHPVQFNFFCILAIVLLYWELAVSFALFFGKKQHLLLSTEIVFSFFGILFLVLHS